LRVLICARESLTGYGVRSLGPFALAHYRVYGDAALAQSFLEPMAEHVHTACEGSISEIFDGDAPHAPGGCFAQAWSVGEVLRAWLHLEQQKRQAVREDPRHGD
jgi:glycogen debranching enzyme